MQGSDDEAYASFTDEIETDNEYVPNKTDDSDASSVIALSDHYDWDCKFWDGTIVT